MGYFDQLEDYGFWGGEDVGEGGGLLDYTWTIIRYNWIEPVEEVYRAGSEYYFDEGVTAPEFIKTPAFRISNGLTTAQLLELRDAWKGFYDIAERTFNELWAANVNEKEMVAFDWFVGHARSWVKLFEDLIQMKAVPQNFDFNSPYRAAGDAVNVALGDLIQGTQEALPF